MFRKTNLSEMLEFEIKKLEEENLKLKNKIKTQEKMDTLIKQQKDDIENFRYLCLYILRLQYHENLPNLVEISNEDLYSLALEKLKVYKNLVKEEKSQLESRCEKLYYNYELFIEMYVHFLISHGMARTEAIKILHDPQKVFDYITSHEAVGETSASNHYICDLVKEKDSVEFSKAELETIEKFNYHKKSSNSTINDNSNRNDNKSAVAESNNTHKKASRKFSKYEKKLLDEMSEELDEVAWAIVEAIGLFGLSQRKEIVNKVLELINFSSKPTKINSTLKAIAEFDNLIIINKIKLPSAGNVDIIELGLNGVKLYEYNFGEKPVESEAHKIIVEHDNLLHGYGIEFLAKALQESGRYNSISTTNKNNGIEVIVNNKKTVYVPDLICYNNSNVIDYYEYELNNHNIKNFCNKCEKMIRVTETLRFVVPNKTIALSLNKKIEAWLLSKSKYALKNTFIKIYSFKSLVEENRALIEYDLSVSTAPVKNI